jgi:hypothetical protein
MKGISDSQMADGASQTSAGPLNYFTLIEQHFQRARGAGSFLLSPRDFALAKAWQDGGLPLEAVLRGIDRVFENWRKRPARARTEQVNSLAYCTQAVMAEAQVLVNASRISREARPPFTIEDVRNFITRNAAALAHAGQGDLASTLRGLNLEKLYFDLEELDRHLTAIEENVIARLRANASDAVLNQANYALEKELRSYREKMTAGQLAQLEKQFLDRMMLESAGLPRLSLFYL